ncbi:hypothetical protein [Thiothrix lacustris]|uniref:hypothetical protein n=1 Tax=Thiothrix lacustris TaxID=525917 RepID=UPI0027E54577|nr:hypothetical protein [Thiothrix lacustris]WMP19440.1 hypothetical protein RCS87_19310 [Thiothrix lacustris]
MAEEMERLRFMQGEWAVDAHLMSEEGEWVSTPLPNATTILPMIGGACHYEIMPVMADGIITHLLFSWSYDPHRQVYRMLSCDDASGLMGVLEGNFIDDSNTVVINDVNTDTAVLDTNRQPAFFRQLASTKTSEDSFTDIVSESYDGGATWQPVFRAIHTRQSLHPI